MRKARATTVCPYCGVAIIRGEQIASRNGGYFGHIAHYLPERSVCQQDVTSPNSSDVTQDATANEKKVPLSFPSGTPQAGEPNTRQSSP